MTKYLLRFNKKDNMRFISHLDLGRLFSRSIKKSEIDVAFSEGFNPHEKTNIVQPLSLGIESDSEYFEITTKTDYPIETVLEALNSCMPLGMNFYEGKVISLEGGTYSNKCVAAHYEAKINLPEDLANKINIIEFSQKKSIMVMKRDKKTKTYIPKDVTNFVYSITPFEYSEGLGVDMVVRCAPNETLNPINLLTALLKDYDVEFIQGDCRITRIDILSTTSKNEFVSLFEV